MIGGIGWVSECVIAKDYNITFYDPQWKSQLDADYIDTVLCPSDEEFLWYVLHSATT